VQDGWLSGRLLPASAIDGAGRLLITRTLRAVADGLVAASLSKYLIERGFSKSQIGLFITATLLGSAVVVIAMARTAGRMSMGHILRWCSLLMVGTGALLAVVPWFVPLVAIAAIGPLNPSAGDVSAFLPAEQTILSAVVSDGDRTAMFARYNLVGFAGGALGPALIGIPLVAGRHFHWTQLRSLSAIYLFYASVGALCWVLYRPFVRASHRSVSPPSRLGASKPVVRRLTLLFCLDSAGGGLVLNSLIALWLDQRHHFSLARIGGVLAITGLLSACSSLAAPALARRIGLVQTMVFTHLPANVLLIGVAFAPSARIAVGLLFARSLMSQMDVPARQSFVMSVVTPTERAAAAAYTNVPRSLAAATTPAFAGWLLSRGSFGWHLVVGGAMKIVYDIALLAQFGRSPGGDAKRQSS
jgi:predicted MFS family arabinose efflux permease